MARNVKNISSINKTKLNLSYKKCVEEIKEIQRIYKMYFDKESNKLNQIFKDISDTTNEILKVL